MFSFTTCVFRPVDYSNGRKCFVSYVISCRFNFYQICQFCRIIVWVFSSLMYVTCFIMPIKIVFKLDCERIWAKNAENKNISNWGALIWQCRLLNDALWFVKWSFTVPFCSSCNMWRARPGWDCSCGWGGVWFQQWVRSAKRFNFFFLCLIFLFLYFW